MDDFYIICREYQDIEYIFNKDKGSKMQIDMFWITKMNMKNSIRVISLYLSQLIFYLHIILSLKVVVTINFNLFLCIFYKSFQVLLICLIIFNKNYRVYK